MFLFFSFLGCSKSVAALPDSLGKSAQSQLALFALYWLVVTFPCGTVHILVMIRLRVVFGGRRVGQVLPSYQNRQISALDETADAPQSSLFSLFSFHFSLPLLFSSLLLVFSSSCLLSFVLSLIFSCLLSLFLLCLLSLSLCLLSRQKKSKIISGRTINLVDLPYFGGSFAGSRLCVAGIQGEIKKTGWQSIWPAW